MTFPFELDYRLAITTGGATKRFNRDGGFHVAKWTGPDDACEWRLLVSQPGRYRVLMSYAAPPDSAGRRFVVRIGDQAIQGTVENTGEGYRYREFDLGLVELRKAGPLTVRVAPVAPGGNLMYFQHLALKQLGGVAVE